MSLSRNLHSLRSAHKSKITFSYLKRPAIGNSFDKQVCIIYQTLVKSKKVSVLGEDGCDNLLQAASEQLERCDILKHLNCAGKEKTGLSPPVKYFYWPFQCGTSFVEHSFYFCRGLLCFCVRLFIVALWSPAGKGLTSWLSFVMSNCEFVTFQLISCFRCGT